MTTPSILHHDGSVKYATDALIYKIHTREDITIGTCNVRTLNATGKLKELIQKMEGYCLNILRLCEERWKNFGEASIDEGNKIYFSGKEDRHEHSVEVLINKNTVNSVIGCQPISR